MFNKIKATPLTPACGAYITGVDLSESLNDEVIYEIRKALAQYCVIFFRDQDITLDQHLAFAKRFGDLLRYPLVPGLESHPDIVPILKLEDEDINFGGSWHSDTYYLEKPPFGAIMVARELPPYGGDTIFANMAMAYDDLSDVMKETLSGLIGIYRSDGDHAQSQRENRQFNMLLIPEPFQGEHPVVQTHPVTGKKILHVNSNHVVAIKGMTDKESAAILNFIFDHQRNVEYYCRFKWEKGSVAFWDNRSTQHYALNDYNGHKRLMHRITLAGGVPK